MRKLLEVVGDVFGNVLVDSVVSIAATILLLPQVKSVGELDFSDARLISVYLIIVVALTLFLRLVGVFFIWLSEQCPASIDIITDTDDYKKHIRWPGIDSEDVYDNNLQKEITYNYAVLRVVNREYKELTECYAVLKSVYVIDTYHGYVDLSHFFFGVGLKKLRWKDNDSCEIKIGPRTGEAILRVYRFGVDNSDHSCVVSDFNICDTAYKAHKVSPTKCFFEIEINGKLDNKEIKPKKFIGYINGEFIKTEGGASYGLGVWKEKDVLNEIQKTKVQKEKSEQPFFRFAIIISNTC